MSHYKTLGVKQDATAEEIKKAYRRLAREFHPDTNPSARAEERFKEIALAYEILSDDRKRQEYDLGLAHGHSYQARPPYTSTAYASQYMAIIEAIYAGAFHTPEFVPKPPPKTLLGRLLYRLSGQKQHDELRRRLYEQEVLIAQAHREKLRRIFGDNFTFEDFPF